MRRNITKRLGIWALIVAALLMIPLIAKWPWTLSDFIFGAIMLFGSATIYELVTRNMKNAKYRLAVGIAILVILAIVWVGAATGFGLE